VTSFDPISRLARAALTAPLLGAVAFPVVAGGCAPPPRVETQGPPSSTAVIASPQKSPLPPGFIEGPKGRLRVSDGGTGEGAPIVFVHGFGGAIDSWTAQLEHVRKSRRAIAFDWAGHGESEAPNDGDESIGALARDLGVVLDHAGLARVVLVSHSMGSAVVTSYANQHPERVLGVVLVDPPPDFTLMGVDIDAPLRAMDAAAYAHWLDVVAADECARDPRVLERFGRSAHTVSLSTAKSAMASLKTFPARDGLAAVAGRAADTVLIVLSDRPHPPASLDHLLPELRHATLAGTDHCLMMEDPEGFDRLLDEFVTELEHPLPSAERAADADELARVVLGIANARASHDAAAARALVALPLSMRWHGNNGSGDCSVPHELSFDDPMKAAVAIAPHPRFVAALQRDKGHASRGTYMCPPNPFSAYDDGGPAITVARDTAKLVYENYGCGAPEGPHRYSFERRDSKWRVTAFDDGCRYNEN
jgi:pimeloyl-ACP methyl ester carboxylesterase